MSFCVNTDFSLHRFGACHPVHLRRDTLRPQVKKKSQDATGLKNQYMGHERSFDYKILIQNKSVFSEHKEAPMMDVKTQTVRLM